ncbi:hypothetical protein BDB01DRAFT_124646 [Pilobolus umbonatus]|nr:hypothetical protein BDB01DRAFT_124646 [Pilobolus umbonatus]
MLFRANSILWNPYLYIPLKGIHQNVVNKSNIVEELTPDTTVSASNECISVVHGYHPHTLDTNKLEVNSILDHNRPISVYMGGSVVMESDNFIDNRDTSVLDKDNTMVDEDNTIVDSYINAVDKDISTVNKDIATVEKGIAVYKYTVNTVNKEIINTKNTSSKSKSASTVIIPPYTGDSSLNNDDISLNNQSDVFSCNQTLSPGSSQSTQSTQSTKSPTSDHSITSYLDPSVAHENKHETPVHYIRRGEYYMPSQELNLMDRVNRVSAVVVKVSKRESIQ